MLDGDVNLLKEVPTKSMKIKPPWVLMISQYVQKLFVLVFMFPVNGNREM